MNWKSVGPGELQSADGRWTVRQVRDYPYAWTVAGPARPCGHAAPTPAAALRQWAAEQRAWAATLAALADEAEAIANDGITIEP